MSKKDAEARLGCLLVSLIMIGIIGVSIVKFWGGLNIQYSTGTRSGTVTKISKKGWLFQTWEGELDLHRLKPSSGDNPTTESDIFYFSVSSDAVADQVMLAEESGNRVTVKYTQYFLRGWKYGATSYDVESVTDSGHTATPVSRFGN